MKQAALVMGFGFGQANKDVASWVRKRNELGDGNNRFSVILTQDAVGKLLSDINVQEMHGHHHKHYVDTVDAAGLGFMRLHQLFGDDARVCVEVLAHERQSERANAAASNALNWLQQNPADASLAHFLQNVTLHQANVPPFMRMNRLLRDDEAWRHPWTCQRHLYKVMDAKCIKRRFDDKRKQFDPNPGSFYDHLKNLEQKITNAQRAQ